MRIEEGIKLDFDDVLIRPKRSDAPSRKSVELLRTFKMPYSGQEFTCLPIIAANLDTVGTFAMARALAKQFVCCALHKFYSLDDLEYFYSRDKESLYSFYTLGIKDDDLVKLTTLTARVGGLNLICVDVANGYTKYFVNKVKIIRELYPYSVLMAGNVATPEMVQELILEGVDIVKVGIGPGAFCKTRLVTGVGYPQLSAIIECADAAHGLGGFVCADGGCKTSGDIAKAFGAGADFVMLGGMLAGTLECEGTWTEEGLQVYGMSSKEAQDKYSGGIPEYATSEGKCSIVPAKGPVTNILSEITGGLRSACSYVGARGLKDFSKCTTFVRTR
jgi:GMP reductase